MKKILFLILIALSLGKEKVNAQHIIPECGQRIFCIIYNDTITVVFRREANEVVNYKVGKTGDPFRDFEDVSASVSTFSVPISEQHGKVFCVNIWRGPDWEKTDDIREQCTFDIP